MRSSGQRNALVLAWTPGDFDSRGPTMLIIPAVDDE
jgi:hypothetical protein